MGGARPRDILRLKGDLPAELGLDKPTATDAAILEAMVAHPVLVERPIVERGAKAVLARPAERWKEVLQA